MANEPRSQTQTREPNKTITLNWYMVTSPHTVVECMQALDQVASMGEVAASQWKWGCMSGDHTGYAFVHAESPEQALRMVPENVREKAHVEKVEEFTIDQIKAFHK
jgi:hypothetical protein